MLRELWGLFSLGITDKTTALEKVRAPQFETFFETCSAGAANNRRSRSAILHLPIRDNAKRPDKYSARSLRATTPLPTLSRRNPFHTITPE